MFPGTKNLTKNLPLYKKKFNLTKTLHKEAESMHASQPSIQDPEMVWNNLCATGALLSTSPKTIVCAIKAITMIGTDRGKEAYYHASKALDLLKQYADASAEVDFRAQSEYLLRLAGVMHQIHPSQEGSVIIDCEARSGSTETQSSDSSALIESYFRDCAHEFSTGAPLSLKGFIKYLRVYSQDPTVQFTDAFLQSGATSLPIEPLLPFTYPKCKHRFIIPFGYATPHTTLYATLIVDCKTQRFAYYQPNGCILRDIESHPLLVESECQRLRVRDLVQMVEKKYGITKDWHIAYQQANDAFNTGLELFYLLYFSICTTPCDPFTPPHPQHITQGKQTLLEHLEKNTEGLKSPPWRPTPAVSTVSSPTTRSSNRSFRSLSPPLPPVETQARSDLVYLTEESHDQDSTQAEPPSPHSRPARCPESPIGPAPPTYTDTCYQRPPPYPVSPGLQFVSSLKRFATPPRLGTTRSAYPASPARPS